MSEKNNSAMNSAPANFSREKNPGCISNNIDDGATASKTLTHAANKVSDLKPLLGEFLSTLIFTVKATAGIIKISPPPHGLSPQIISSAGFPAGLIEEDSAININCGSFGNDAIGRGFYSDNLDTCKTRHDCRYVGCQFQSIIAAPLENPEASGNHIGALTLFFDTPQELSGHATKTIQAFTNLLGAILEHNRSNCEAKRVDLIAERQSIANEIHDSLAQTLAYARMRTSLLFESIRANNKIVSTKYAHDIDDALEISQKTVRELITDFRCAMDPAGLPRALQMLVEKFSHQNNIALEYVNLATDLEMPLEYEIQVYHIIREALANIANHSGASHASLRVGFMSDIYNFTVKDNGSGGCTFTPVEGHYGMMIMRERAQRIAGEIRVESSKGFGTCVQLFFQKPGADWRSVNE